MHFTTFVTIALAAVASAHRNETVPVYVTEVVTALTTFCPEPTSVVHNGVTYTVTEATTLTITDCPCTVSYPVAPTAPAPPSYHPPAGPSSVYQPPAPTTLAPGNPPHTVTPQLPVGTPSKTNTPVPTFTGAANKLAAGGLAAAAGLAACIL